MSSNFPFESSQLSSNVVLAEFDCSVLIVRICLKRTLRASYHGLIYILARLASPVTEVLSLRCFVSQSLAAAAHSAVVYNSFPRSLTGRQN